MTSAELDSLVRQIGDAFTARMGAPAAAAPSCGCAHGTEDAEVADGLRSVRAVCEGRCHVLDGNALFTRPGPRLAESVEVLASVLHPDLFPGHVERYRAFVRRWS